MDEILVVAEKPSVARDIARVLGASARGEGRLTGGGYVVTWAIGHLVALKEPEELDERYRRWRAEDLPILPERMQLKVLPKTRAQFSVVKKLMNSREIRSIICATDSGREGELIFRYIYEMAGCQKPVDRLWISSMTDEAIRAGFAALRPASRYDALYQSARCRSEADWLVGMNASRAFTLRYGALLSVGRVQTPTLAMLVSRRREIDRFVPQPYWTVQADFGDYQGVWFDPSREDGKRIPSEAAARAIADKVRGKPARVTGVKAEEKRELAPQLYDLTTLQREASSQLGFSAERTLKTAQSLYEKRKLITYPRTDSRYITHDDLETLTALLESGRLAQGFVTREGIPGHPRPELAVNDAKVAGHTAILPTMQLDAGKLEGLDDDERKVMTRIVRRMWEAVGDDHVHIVTEVKARLSDDTDREFSSRSDETVSAGWKAVETGHGPEPEDEETANPAGGRNVIPSNLMEGGVIRPVGKVTVEEGETRPPKPFTEATLLAAMEHASRCVEDKNLKAALDDDESHSGGIGTPATRADTIEKLVRSKLVERKGRQLHATTEGERLTDVVEPRLKDVLLTARMEQALSDVEHGKRGPSEVMDMFHREALRIPADATANLKADAVTRTANTDAQEWGDCPRCGQPVRKTGRMWQCSTNKTEKTKDGKWATTAGCGWKMFARIAGKTITDQTARRLLAGQSVTLKGFTSKSGKKFDAAIRIDKERGTAFDFDR